MPSASSRRRLLADPRDYRTLNAYGVVLDMLGRHAEAQAKYRQGIELAPDYLALRNNYGLSLAISGQPQEAIAQLAPLASSRGADGRTRQNLAFAYAMNGDLENCLLVSRKDLDEASAQRQLSYFMQLRSLPVEARSAELRRNPNFFPQVQQRCLDRGRREGRPCADFTTERSGFLPASSD